MVKVNYSYQKKQKELASKRKQQEKIKNRLAKKKLEGKGGSETGSE